MANLFDKDTSALIVVLDFESLNQQDRNRIFEKLNSVFYSKNYLVKEIFNEFSGKSLVGISTEKNNNNLRVDALHMTELFTTDSVYVKYYGDSHLTQIKSDGGEINFEMRLYEHIENCRQFYSEGIMFSIKKMKRYHYPKKKENLKDGMIIEFLNNDKVWKPRKIMNIDAEFEKTYKLLIKYQKIRVEID